MQQIAEHLYSIKTLARAIEDLQRKQDEHSGQIAKINPGAVALWLAARGLSTLRKQCWKDAREVHGLTRWASRPTTLISRSTRSGPLSPTTLRRLDTSGRSRSAGAGLCVLSNNLAA
jgi:hypothetical protein